MKHLQYKDFNEVYFELNRVIALGGYEYLDAPRACIEDLIIDVPSTNCDRINLAALGYGKNKWAHLLRSYLVVPDLEAFHKTLQTSPGMSLAFDFNRKKQGNGSCLREMVFTRSKKGKFTKVTVFWRVCETHKKLAADLILIKKIIESAPNVDPNIRIVLYMTQAYQAATYGPPIIHNVIGVDLNKLKPNNKYQEGLVRSWKAYYQEGCRTIKQAAMEKMQVLAKKYRDKEDLGKLTYKDLEIPFTKPKA